MGTNSEIVTEREIILLRDTMPTEELRRITQKAEKEFGHVSYRTIFKAMGYTHAFNDKWYKPKN